MTKEKIAKLEKSDWYRRIQAFKILMEGQDKQSAIRRVTPNQTWNMLVDSIKKEHHL